MSELRERYSAEIEELAAASRRLGELGFVASHGGNLSYKVADDTILITPTKVVKRQMQPDDIVIVTPGGEVLHAAELLPLEQPASMDRLQHRSRLLRWRAGTWEAVRPVEGVLQLLGGSGRGKTTLLLAIRDRFPGARTSRSAWESASRSPTTTRCSWTTSIY